MKNLKHNKKKKYHENTDTCNEEITLERVGENFRVDKRNNHKTVF
jgi:hypothetical protein